MNKRGQIPEAFVGLLAVILIVYAIFQFNAYGNEFTRGAYNVTRIEQVYMSEEHFKKVVRDGLEGIAEENKNRKTLVGPPLEPRDATDSDEEFYKRKLMNFVDNEINKRDDNDKDLILSHLKQLKSHIEFGRVIYDAENNYIDIHIPDIVFQYGTEKFFEEEYKGKITLVYQKDFIFRVEV
ncbi:hypothetical protein HYV49_00140 [Candidatus Pacearchaeota archaeon]|nr:hypothetical protein [Candidatus Pacearchaeota archaeon]